jgi:HTH-type transcriptional regulator/antitoxin HigA
MAMSNMGELYQAAEPDYAVPPGETIREFLDELNMTQRELATRLDLSPKHVNQLVQGLVPLSTDVAARLELVTGMPARLWLRLEADYQAINHRLRQRIDLAESTTWLQEIPIGELVKRNAIPAEPSDKISRTQQALAFFGVAHISTYRELYEGHQLHSGRRRPSRPIQAPSPRGCDSAKSPHVMSVALLSIDVGSTIL